MPVVLPVSRPSKFRPEVLGRSGAAFGGLLGPTATRYVRKSGSDSNGGTSPSDAWLTVGKALTTAASGTVVYVGAGVYRETLSVSITPLQDTQIVGDVFGFFTGDAGEVQITGYTTSDKAAPSSTTLLNLNGKSNLTFRNIVFVGGNAVMLTATTATSQNINFVSCAFIPGMNQGSAIANVTCPYGVPLNWRIDRCIFGVAIAANVITFNLTTGAPAFDYDAQVLITNCSFIACGASGATNQRTIQVAPVGALAGKGGGVRVRNCIAYGSVNFVSLNGAALSAKIPCEMYGCIISATQFYAACSTIGSLIEDYNYVLSGTAFQTTGGAHSIINGSYAPLFSIGQERIWGGNPRPFGEPTLGSPLLGFGMLDTQVLVDERGGPRPAQASDYDVGPFQRGNNFAKEIGTVHTGSNAISITGSGFQDFDIYVDAGAVTVSVFCQYDSSYSGPRPQLQVVNGAQVGVSDASVVADPSSLSAFAQLSLTVNPNAAGIVTVRLVAGDVSGVGKTIFDTFAVA